MENNYAGLNRKGLIERIEGLLDKVFKLEHQRNTAFEHKINAIKERDEARQVAEELAEYARVLKLATDDACNGGDCPACKMGVPEIPWKP